MDGDLTTDLLFTLNGEDVFSATSYDKATIAWISVGSPKIRFKVHDKFYGCGDDLSQEVKAKPDDFGWDDASGASISMRNLASLTTRMRIPSCRSTLERCRSNCNSKSEHHSQK